MAIYFGRVLVVSVTLKKEEMKIIDKSSTSYREYVKKGA
jgi:hypothetical protein